MLTNNCTDELLQEHSQGEKQAYIGKCLNSDMFRFLL